MEGVVLDRAYISTAKKYGFPVDKRSGEDNPAFPIAKARLRIMPYSILSTTTLVIAYGWSLHAKTVSRPLSPRSRLPSPCLSFGIPRQHNPHDSFPTPIIADTYSISPSPSSCNSFSAPAFSPHSQPSTRSSPTSTCGAPPPRKHQLISCDAL